MYHYLAVLRSTNPLEIPPEEFILIDVKTYKKDMKEAWRVLIQTMDTNIKGIKIAFPNFTGDPKTTVFQLQDISNLIGNINGNGPDTEYSQILSGEHYHHCYGINNESENR